MKTNRSEVVPTRCMNRLRGPVAAIALLAGLTACSGEIEGAAHPKPGVSVTPTPEQPPAFVMVTPDFSKLPKGGLCVGSDPNDCVLPIRKDTNVNKPAVEDNVFNLINGAGEMV